MPQPDIFRRCSSCGASCRTGELFCAQCGNALAPQPAAPPGTTAEQNVGVGEHDFETNANSGPEVSEVGETVNLPTAGFEADQPVRAPDDSPPAASTPTNSAAPAAVIGHVRHDSNDSRMRSQQPRSATRAAMEGRVKPGVDKLRRVSSVVLDEAAFDPGVRFILVVGVLFLLFLVLLLLSKWIG